MPPHPTPIFMATSAPIPIVLEAVPPELDTKLEDDAKIQQQMDADKRRLEDAAKAKIGELRDKKQKEKADWKKQEELDRKKQEEEIWKEVDQKRWEELEHLKKTEDKQTCWVDIDGVSSIFMFHDLELTHSFNPPKLLPMQRQGHPRGR